MSKNGKAKPVRIKDPQKSAAIRRALMHSLAVLVFAGLLVGGVQWIKGDVETRLVSSDRPPRVVIKNRPTWMSDALASEFIRILQPTKPSSPFDNQLLIDTVSILSRNPWIKQIRSVRRAYDKRPGDILEIDCDFRAPIALVKWQDYYWLIDTESVKLPQQFTANQLPSIIRGDDGKLNIRIIEGVNHPPVASGYKWGGDDLAAAIELVKLLYGRSFAEEIIRVNVANFGGRIDPREAQMTLVTKHDTVIRWGRPINAQDFFVEIPTTQKLQHLEQIWARFHRVDAGRQWIDIRFDKITYPSTEGTAQTDAGR